MNTGNSNTCEPSPKEQSNDVVRFDVNTTFESFFTTLAGMFLLGALIFLRGPYSVSGAGTAKWFATGALAISIMRLFLDSTYAVDPSGRMLIYTRLIFGWEKSWKVATFDEITAVRTKAFVTKTQKGTFYNYAVAVDLIDGSTVLVSDQSRFQSIIDGKTETFKQLMANNPADDSDTIKRVPEPNTRVSMEPIDIQWRSMAIFGKPSLYSWIILLLSLAITVYQHFPTVFE